ncbi:hypothetical protein KTE71_20800 [Burkholderia multivorans]|uniref:hypothetical protein n=1 Tax=Burkholderia multivorans TaxID=87883 RepID=UPI001C25833B|nr:hypothetical protein [Burkholderia multivorans]MBU9389949.1 hypothetical protein [Burkholderia multivorans]
MDDTQHPNDFPPLTPEQIQGLAESESIRASFGGNFTRAAFVNHLLALLEDLRRRRRIRSAVRDAT